MVDKTDIGVPLGTEFFERVLPRVSDLAELKLILLVSKLALDAEGPGVDIRRLSEPQMVRLVCGDQSPEPGELRIRRVLERAMANGFLLRFALREAGAEVTYILPATAEKLEMVERLRSGDAPEGFPGMTGEADVTLYRPNAFSLYEEHIGPLTPLVAEHLREAERSYPLDWLERAIAQAAEHNHRNWRYVEAILGEWERTGTRGRA